MLSEFIFGGLGASLPREDKMGVVLERPSKFYMVVGDIHEFNGEKLMS